MKFTKFIGGSEGVKILKNGLWKNHPVTSMSLGICSALAVSNRVENAIAMSTGLLFVLLATAILISMVRKIVPARARIITYMIVISTFVIVVDRALKAYFPVISESVGPYVGLIITNCIIMGRAEAFFSQKPIIPSMLDGIANSLGYAYTLITIAVIRELLGFGTILGIPLVTESFEKWLIMSMAPGAFFLIGIFLWITRTISPTERA